MPSPIIDIEGGDGNGKSTALHAVREYFEERLDAASFDVITFEQQHGHWPAWTEIDALGIAAAKILIVGEPTYINTGAEIRRALKAPTPEFDDPWFQAQRYAQDRQELMRGLILPYFSYGGRRVIRSRGLLSSLAYQVPQIAKRESLSLEVAVQRVMLLDGNSYSIQFAPELCLLLDLPLEEASRRMHAGRSGELDHFERNVQLQRELRTFYHDPVIQAPFRDNGTQFATIDTSGSKEATREQIFQVLRSFYP